MNRNKQNLIERNIIRLDYIYINRLFIYSVAYSYLYHREKNVTSGRDIKICKIVLW